MKTIKLPSTPFLIIASLGAFWLAHQMNPGFNPVGIMILLLIPIFIINLLFPQNELTGLLDYFEAVKEFEQDDEPQEPEQTVTGELVDETEEPSDTKP